MVCKGEALHHLWFIASSYVLTSVDISSSITVKSCSLLLHMTSAVSSTLTQPHKQLLPDYFIFCEGFWSALCVCGKCYSVVQTLCAACRWIQPERSQLFWFGSITWQTWKVWIGLFCSSISVIASHCNNTGSKSEWRSKKKKRLLAMWKFPLAPTQNTRTVE